MQNSKPWQDRIMFPIFVDRPLVFYTDAPLGFPSDGYQYWSDSLNTAITPTNFEKHNKEIKTKTKYPLSHDPILWIDKDRKANSSEYNDRMWQQKHDQYSSLALKIFGNAGQTGLERQPFNKLQQFLQQFYDDSTIRLARMIEYRHCITGFPYYRFDIWSEKS